jgi:hypothetical protein
VDDRSSMMLSGAAVDRGRVKAGADWVRSMEPVLDA